MRVSFVWRRGFLYTRFVQSTGITVARATHLLRRPLLKLHCVLSLSRTRAASPRMNRVKLLAIPHGVSKFYVFLYRPYLWCLPLTNCSTKTGIWFVFFQIPGFVARPLYQKDMRAYYYLTSIYFYRLRTLESPPCSPQKQACSAVGLGAVVSRGYASTHVFFCHIFIPSTVNPTIRNYLKSFIFVSLCIRGFFLSDSTQLRVFIVLTPTLLNGGTCFCSP